MLLAATVLTCVRGGAEPPDVEVVGLRVRLASEKRGAFLLALRLRDAPRSPLHVSAVRCRLKIGPHPFFSGMRTLDIHLEPGARELPEFSLPFAVEDPLSWEPTLDIRASGEIELNGTDAWIGFDRRLEVEVEYPPPPPDDFL